MEKSTTVSQTVLEAQQTDTLPAQEAPPAAPLRRNRSFLCLWGSQVFSQLADRIIFVAFISLIVQHHGASESYNSWLYIAFTIPAILLTAIAGVFIDRWPRRMTLLLTNLLRAGLMLLTPLAIHSSLIHLYTLAFFLSAVTQFFVPAEAATIPAIVPKSQLVQANSAFTTTMMASVIVGFALGDPFINWLGLDGIHWGISALFLIATVLLLGLRLPRDVVERVAQNRETTLSEAMASFRADLKEGADFVFHNDRIWKSMAKLGLLFSALVALCILSISFAKTYLYADPLLAARKFAYIIAFSGVGMALGAALLTKPLEKAHPPTLVYIGLGLVGAALLALTATGALLPSRDALFFAIPAWSTPFLSVDVVPVTLRMAYTYAWAFVLGVGASFTSIPVQALLHERIPEAIRGKVLGLQFTLLSTSSTLPVLLAGLGTEWLGVLPMLWLLGMPFLVWSVWGLLQSRRLERQGRRLEW